MSETDKRASAAVAPDKNIMSEADSFKSDSNSSDENDNSK